VTEVREAQRRTLSLANTGMVVTIDIGDPTNIYPADSRRFAHRSDEIAGRLDRFQPPPSAFTNRTLASMRRRMMSISVC
jgi:hypothetical protein